MLSSQNPRILIKIEDFLDGDPPYLLLEMVQLFCTVPNFLQAVPTRDTKNQHAFKNRVCTGRKDGSSGRGRQARRKPGNLPTDLGDPGRGVLSQIAGIVEIFLTVQYSCFYLKTVQYSTTVFL